MPIHVFTLHTKHPTFRQGENVITKYDPMVNMLNHVQCMYLYPLLAHHMIHIYLQCNLQSVLCWIFDTPQLVIGANLFLFGLTSMAVMKI
jgi:hypothetical protein